MTTVSEIALLPDNVVHFNFWTGFQSKEIRALFECIPIDDLAKLNRGDTIWIDAEQPSGKVYGFNRAEVMSIEVSDASIGIQFKGPSTEGCIGIDRLKRWHKLHRCTDTPKLVELVSASPLTTETGTVGSISDESRAFLEASGARVRSA